jgi:hypothetical protein
LARFVDDDCRHAPMNRAKKVSETGDKAAPANATEEHHLTWQRTQRKTTIAGL